LAGNRRKTAKIYQRHAAGAVETYGNHVNGVAMQFSVAAFDSWLFAGGELHRRGRILPRALSPEV